MKDIFIATLISLPVSFVCCVIVHEFGHLLFGAVSGYSFVALEIFGIRLARTFGRYRLKTARRPCMGQCLMLPKGRNVDPCPLILGGIVMNVHASVICLIVLHELIFGSPVYAPCALCFLISGFVMNAVGAVTNLIPSGTMNDGSTFFDALADRRRKEIYNRLMELYSELEKGIGPESIDPEIFCFHEFYDSSLSAELAGFRYLYRVGTADCDCAEAVRIRERRRLGKYRAGLIDWEELNEFGYTRWFC